MKVTRTPTNIPTPRPIRRQISRVLSSDQMSALLHESPVARVTPRHLFSRAQSVSRKPLVDNKLEDGCTTKSTKNSSVVRKSLTITDDSSTTENNSTESVPSNKAFCKMFSGWLENTERESDSERFDRLKEDLWKLVGKYALEMHKDGP